MVKIYSTSWCPSCIYAKRLLSERGLEFEEINIEEKGWSRDDLFELTGGRTVPQIIIDEKPVGGYDDLLKLDSVGEGAEGSLGSAAYLCRSLCGHDVRFVHGPLE